MVDQEEYIYTEVIRRELRDTIKKIAEESINSPFGICFLLKGGGIKINAISPASVRLDGSVVAPVQSGVFEDYEGYMSKPTFLPLYSEKNRGIESYLYNLSKFMLPNEKVVVQFMFRKLIGITWKEELLKMYDSYLRGNDFPLSSTFGRVVQEKAINVLGRIGSFQLNREYIPEVEDKILDVGYEFQLAVGIRSKESDILMKRIANAVKEYNFYNSIKLRKVNHRSSSSNFFRANKNNILGGVFSLNAVPKHIVSEKEMLALLAGSTGSDEAVDLTEINEVMSQRENNIFRLLPMGVIDREPSELDEKALVSEIAEKLKRVGLISVARLYNESVTEGLRLIVVQFDIPKNKNISHLQQKSKDIQAALGVLSLSIEQGNDPDTVKFVLPNDKPSVVSLREIIELDSFHEFKSQEENALSFVAGVDEINKPIYLSLSKLIHLLVAGTTGSGKSVFINTLAVSLLSTHSPEDLQMIMIDPKMVELQHYGQFPHVREVITDMNKAESTLRDLADEMDRRYEEFHRIGVKTIQLYNQSDKKEKYMPYLVCIIDEYADLKDTNPDVEEHIGRLGQKARASGIHMVIATQRPDAKIIGGRIKAVIPNAISFNLNNNNDYRTVFGFGVEGVTLLGRGDGLMKINGQPRLKRFQSCIISVDESKEAQVYKNLANAYGRKTVIASSLPSEESVSISSEETPLDELKRIIATTGETRLTPLRNQLGIRAETLTGLMKELVDGGWLVKHETGLKGYELIASQKELNKWKGV